VNRYRGLIFPILLIGLGLIALLVNLGALSWSQVVRVFDLWPLLLIVIGIELILRRAAAPPVANGLGAAVAVVAVVAAVAYAAAGPVVEAGEHSGTASAPLAGAGCGQLAVTGGGVRFSAHLGDTGGDLYRASFRNPNGDDPAFAGSSGSVTIRYGRGRGLFGSLGQRSLDLTLNSGLGWTLNLEGGGFAADIDLHQGGLNGLSLSGGGINLDAHLPAPQGTVRIAISGGGVNAGLHRPPGVAARVTVTGGGSAIDADGSHQSALAGTAVWTSSDFAGAGDRYDVTVSGGGTHVSIDSSG
jgi:cell wall-active antibiotic response 4TMS protein YvqF